MFKLTFFLLILSFCCLLRAENIDNDIERFCYPEIHKNSRRSCECYSENASPWGTHALTIDCSYKELQTKDFNEVLPLYVTSLDLSWNSLDRVPMFASNSLTVLNMMHNNITSLTIKNFFKISNLHELYLSWNSIQSIELNAFDDLKHLRVLDLSHNNLHALSLQTFSEMKILDTLSLSWNRQLNETKGIQDRDFYQTFGVNKKLRILNMEACSLVNITLPENAPLEELNLRRNRLNRIPKRLPSALKKLDISENIFESLKPIDTENLTKVEEFYMEDMMRLMALEESSLTQMKALKKISLQNSRRLTSINSNVFGVNTTSFPPLRTMIFRGTMLRGFNATLAPVFRQLTELDLNGMPLYCDCELIWLKQEVKIETNGRCFKPSKVRGMRISNAHASDFKCNTWPQWVYGLIILGLIVLCSVGIYFIVLGFRPHNGVNMRRKVGAGSPYARVTIEPNRQENLS